MIQQNGIQHAPRKAQLTADLSGAMAANVSPRCRSCLGVSGTEHQELEHQVKASAMSSIEFTTTTAPAAASLAFFPGLLA